MGILTWARRSTHDVWGHWPAKAYEKVRYQQRLARVQKQFASALSATSPSRVYVTSICAGDGRDVVGTLATHPRCGDVRATLVELNPESVRNGRARVQQTGLTNVVKFIEGDATNYETYRSVPAADITLVCGTWGHVPAHQRQEMMHALASLCRPEGKVIWTRGVAKGMQRLEEIKSLFVHPAWKELEVEVTPDRQFAVATFQYTGPASPLPATGRIFDFE